MLVWLFLALLLAAALLRMVSSALHLGMLAAHLSVTHLLVAHLIHLVLLAAHAHLLLMLHLLIHGILAVTRTSVFGAFVVLPGLVSSNVVAVKIFPTFFAMFFTARSCSLTLMLSEVSRPVLSSTLFAMFFAAHSCSLALVLVPQFVSSSSYSSCGPDFVRSLALANSFVFVE